LAAAAGLVAVSAGLYWATTDRTFAVDPTTIPITGERYTSEAEIRAQLDLPDDKLINIFRIPVSDIEARIERLPAVRDATVTATLPDQVSVSVTERSPLFVWRTPVGSWLVDGAGFLFSSTTSVDPAELGTGATGTTLPAVDDRRIDSDLMLGARVPPLDMAAIRLLLTVTPEMLRSDVPELYLRMDDEQGYVLDAPGWWRAVFGPYTPVLRPPDIIPRQVQCLDALLKGREEKVSVVTLALSDEMCGTFQERARPRATEKPPKGGDGDGDDAGEGDAGEGNGRRGGRGATPRP
jgi:hypothetical protein